MNSPTIRDMDSNEAFVPVNIPHILHCDYRGCPRGFATKKDLKRCAGCSEVKYCSKECQKAAWPEHKKDCRSGHQFVTHLGFPTSAALTNALKKWSEIHYWTITMIVNGTVYIGSGWKDTLASPHFMFFELEAAPRTQDSNPAEAFRITRVGVARADVDPRIMQAWPAIAEECAYIDRGIRLDKVAGAHTSYAGVLPTRFTLNGTELMLTAKHLVYRISVRHVPDSPRDKRTHAAFADLIRMCTALIYRGVVLCAPEDPTKADPDLGLMERTKKTWKLRKAPRDKVDWEVICSHGKQYFESGLTPVQLFTLFKTG